MEVSEAKRLRELEAENARLKKLLAEAELVKAMRKHLLHQIVVVRIQTAVAVLRNNNDGHNSLILASRNGVLVKLRILLHTPYIIWNAERRPFCSEHCAVVLLCLCVFHIGDTSPKHVAAVGRRSHVSSTGGKVDEARPTSWGSA